MRTTLFVLMIVMGESKKSLDLYRRLKSFRSRLSLRLGKGGAKNIFSKIYRYGLWHPDHDDREAYSGSGSYDDGASYHCQKACLKVLKDYPEVKSFMDVGCGNCSVLEPILDGIDC